MVPQMGDRVERTRSTSEEWKTLVNLTSTSKCKVSMARDLAYRLFWNDDPEALISWSKGMKFKHVEWVTYSLAGRHFVDPVEQTYIGDDELIGRFIQMYSRMANWDNKPIYPLVWVSSPPKSLHLHALEFHQGIKRNTRAKAFRNRFGKLTQLPKDLYGSVIKATPTTDYESCFYYGDRGHNQLVTYLHKPRKFDRYPLELLGNLSSKIKGQVKMMEYHNQNDIDFEKHFLALLSQ